MKNNTHNNERPDWLSQLPQQLADHKTSAPEGLWEDIEATLATPTIGKKKAAIAPLWRWTSVAAMLLLVVGIGARLYRSQDNGEYTPDELAKMIEEVTHEATLNEPAVDQAPTDRDAIKSITHPEHLAKADDKVIAKKKEVTKTDEKQIEEVYPEEKTINEEKATPEENAVPGKDKVAPREETQEVPNQEYVPARRETKVPLTYQTKKSGLKKSHEGRFTLAMMASGMQVDMSGVSSLFHGSEDLYESVNIPMYDSAPGYGSAGTNAAIEYAVNNGAAVYFADMMFTNRLPVALGPSVVSEYDHKLPIKAGVSVRYEITPRWAVVSGLQYSSLRSTVKYLRNNHKDDQQVSFIGVPLGADYTLWENKRLEFYVGSGVTIEKSVSAYRKDYLGDKKKISRPWQFSADVNAGVQYKFTKYIGLFVQPSLGYYFDNGSAIKTYYDEHRFTPTVNLGIKVNL